MRHWPSVAAVFLSLVCLGCGSGEEPTPDPPPDSRVPLGCGSGEEPTPDPPPDSRVPPPERFDASEIQLKECRNVSSGGELVQVAEMTCADADRITVLFTTAFSDRNLRKPLVDRGNGWRCFQRLFDDGFRVQEVCWRAEGQVLVFSK